MAQIPTLRGLNDLAAGEVFKLGPNADVMMGRSRSCAISFQRFRPWLALSDVEQRLRDQFNSAVSRQHVRLLTKGSVITVENRSSTGTRVNGQLVPNAETYDLTQGAITLQLGMATELFQVLLMEEAEVDQLIAALPPIAEPTRIEGVPDPVESPTPTQNWILPP